MPNPNVNNVKRIHLLHLVSANIATGITTLVMEGTGGDRGVTGKLTGQQLIMGTKSVRSWFA